MGFDILENGGHDLVLISGPNAGLYTYICEKCGAVIRMASSAVRLFHSVSGSTVEKCKPAENLPKRSLRQKMVSFQMNIDHIVNIHCPQCDMLLEYEGQTHTDDECDLYFVMNT